MKRFFALIIIALLCACKPGVPKELIQPEKMEKVLFDIHIAEGFATLKSNQDSAKIEAAAFYKGIYKKFEIDSMLYNKSLDYYYKHPGLMKDMYEHISKELKDTKSSDDKAKPVNKSKEGAKK